MELRSRRREQDWLVSERAFDPARLGHSSSLFSLSNGILGTRGGPPEWPDGHSTILAGAFVRLPLSYHERFPGFAEHTDTRLLGPGVTGIRIAIDAEPVDFTATTIVSTTCDLDLRTASLRRHTVWQLADGRRIALSSWRFVPLLGRALCLQRHEITLVDFTAEVEVEFPIEMSRPGGADVGDPRNSARARFVPVAEQAIAEASLWRFAAGQEQQLRLTAAQRLSCATPGVTLDAHRVARGKCKAREPLIVDRHVELRLEAPNHEMGAEARASAESLDNLFEAHRGVVSEFWRSMALDLPADPTLAVALRYNILQVFLSASRTPDLGTAAKGLSGEGYEGHSFWDNEVFVLPMLALSSPEVARNALVWRIGRLDQARANARAVGHPRGALFPWRTIAGLECSTHYPTGAAQYHVNAAIAYALEVYHWATGDRSILADGGAELLVETARLWFDLGHFSERRGGAFLIHGVTGPDEYTALVDNDFYTNAMARRHLLFAAGVLERLAVDDPEFHRSFAERLGIDSAEPAEWRRAAGVMWLPIDPALGVHPQDDTFLDKPLLPARPQRADRSAPLLMQVHPMVLFRHRISKQGDVVQAHVTAGLEASLARIERDLEFYEPLTTHDSTLSLPAFAICASWLGQDEKAAGYWRQTALVDLDDLHGNTDHGLHMAAMAGSWLVLVCGWAGLRLGADQLWLAPRCPSGWPGYSFRFRWQGRLVEVAVSSASTRYTLLEGKPLILLDRGRSVELDVRAPAIVPPPRTKAVIFDLDGVLTDTAEWHFQAWKRLADEHAIPFDRTVNEGLKGVDRHNSLRRILEAAGVELDSPEFEALLVQKNAYYVDFIRNFTPADLLPGAAELLRNCRLAGLRIGLASASRNAAALVERLGIARWFDHIADSATIGRGKPDPEIFLETARALGVAPENCVAIEDASAGIAAIRSAGMASIGVGSAALLPEAERVFPEIGAIGLSDIVGSAGEGPKPAEIKKMELRSDGRKT